MGVAFTYSSPENWPESRLRNFNSGDSQFGSHSVPKCIKAIGDSLRRMGVKKAHLSGAWRIGVNGNVLPSSYSFSGPAVLEYERRQGNEIKTIVIAIDEYGRVWENLWAIHKTLEAMRTIERHAGNAVARQAETGFASLPSSDCWTILGISKTDDISMIERAYRKMAKEYHPDTPRGSEQAFRRLVDAYEEAIRIAEA